MIFVFDDSRLLVVRHAQEIRIPEEGDLERCGIAVIRRQQIGSLGERPCFAAEMADAGGFLPENYELRELRSLFSEMDEEIFWAAGRANQLVHWQQTHLYCGACGRPTQDKSDERAKICTACGLVNYPRLSPAMIVAVLKDDKILLARNKRFQIPIYSVLAGFVEPGETLEACVEREVEEEVGIRVRNIRYFGSQPWPFPNSLMIAFTAEYAGGEIAPDPAEITDAGWYPADDLPRIPSKMSIAGKLIDWFCRRKPSSPEQ
ncbi:MAG: NAD(+) diphosphatase [Thermodesulfobacteriota bacterium]